MAEPTAQRLRVTFTVKRADNGRFMLACDPLESESAPVIPGSDPTESDAAIAASDPTETEAVIRGSDRGVCLRMPGRRHRSASDTLGSADDGHDLAPDVYPALTWPFARQRRGVSTRF
jgi:hypothetical protein